MTDCLFEKPTETRNLRSWNPNKPYYNPITRQAPLYFLQQQECPMLSVQYLRKSDIRVLIG